MSTSESICLIVCLVVCLFVCDGDVCHSFSTTRAGGGGQGKGVPEAGFGGEGVRGSSTMTKFGRSAGSVYKQRNPSPSPRTKDILLGKGKSHSSNKRGYGVAAGATEQGPPQNPAADAAWTPPLHRRSQGQAGGWVNTVVAVKTSPPLSSSLWICLCYVNDLLCV